MAKVMATLPRRSRNSARIVANGRLMTDDERNAWLLLEEGTYDRPIKNMKPK
ncbi:MAG TPA: hypothetical protein VGM57_05060 [Pseudolabrys sp.]